MMGKKIDPEAVGEYIAEMLSQERATFNALALQRHQDMLAETAREAGFSEQEIQATLAALQRGYQERTKP
jgi:hypothetical protein